MKLPHVVIGVLWVSGLMVLSLGACFNGQSPWKELRAIPGTLAIEESGANRTTTQPTVGRRLLQGKAFILSARTTSWLCYVVMACGAASGMWFMFPGVQGSHSTRQPPRWDPSMEQSLPFRTWVQDLMLWTICTDLEPHQQCAAIISQLGGAARELARNITPQEVYNGGVINGVRLDPVSFLLHGLQVRFAPLDEETRLRATQDMLAFTRRAGETIDALISRFELTRARARTEGGGTLGVETAALLLLRACGVNTQQFQVLTQPFGLRLPSTEAELAQMCHHLRRMGHIVERHPQSIASGLRGPQASQQAFVAEADTGSSAGGDMWSSEAPSFNMGQWSAGGETDWAFAAVNVGDGGSDTDSATSSDDDAPMDVGDLRGMTNAQADEYLFGEYQNAKRRWRRFTGKPVRALRKVVKRKGKGKGKGRHSYLNLSDALQQSAYFKGKGKGGRSSGKGFGRRTNPCGRDGEPLKCSTCGSSYHLRARCPRRPDSAAPASQSSSAAGASTAAAANRSGPSFAVEATSGLHFATFESDDSWSRVLTPRSAASSFQPSQASRNVQGHQSATVVQPSQPASEVPHVTAGPVQHQMTPDPWMTEPDPWMEWMHTEQLQEQRVPPAEQPSAEPPRPRTAAGGEIYSSNSWSLPGLGLGGGVVPQSFADVLGLAGPPPPLPSSLMTDTSRQQAAGQLHETHAPQRRHMQRNAAQTVTGAVPGPEAPATRGPRTLPSAFTSLAGVSAPAGVPLTPTQASLGSGDAMQMPDSQMSSQVSVFSQVHALRNSAGTTRRSRAIPEEPPTVEPVPQPRSFQGFVSACAVCLGEYSPGEHVCRLSCGHVYHCLCIGELAVQSGATFGEGEDMSIDCPCCRQQSHVIRSWRYPLIATGEPQPATTEPTEPEPPHASQNAHADHRSVSPEGRPRPEDRVTPDSSPHSEHFHTPDAAYPWWPVESHDASASSTPVHQAYHTSVRLADGRVGLLVDPGSYGNLVGEEWLASAASRMQKVPRIVQRESPLQVGGVGRGAQQCKVDCNLPIMLTRQDGSMAGGTFTSPVVSQSGCPALLGLRSLQDNRAILDCQRKLLHFPAEGEVTLVMPPGSETYQLEAAESGHLLLPCDAFSRTTAQQPLGEHHLFADDSSEQGQDESAQQQHLIAAVPSTRVQEQEACCAAVRADYTHEACAKLVLQLTKEWTQQGSAPCVQADERLSLGKCVGMYTHGGVVGVSVMAKQRPELTKLLCHAVQSAAGASAAFTTIMLNVNITAPVHKDSYNQDHSVLVPLLMPKKGGNLWLELRQGDTVEGALEVRSVGTEQRAGQVLALSVGHAQHFDPKRLHATQQWSSGDRIILAAYTTGSAWKATPESVAYLRSLGFGIPSSNAACEYTACVEQPQAKPQQVPDAVEAHAAEQQAKSRQVPNAVGAQPADQRTKSRHVQGPCRTQHVYRANALGFIRRVLLISIFQSTYFAFQEHGIEPTRVRPTELLRSGFDELISQLKRSEYTAVWVDLDDQRQCPNRSQVFSRLGVVAGWAQRQSIPYVMSSSRNAVWNQPEVQELVLRHKLKQSRHQWCSFGVKVSAEVQASAASHKVMSSVPLPSHACKCPPQTEHLFDLDMHKGQPGMAKLRADAERCVASHIIAALVSAMTPAAEPGPSSTTDSIQPVIPTSCTTSAQQPPSAGQCASATPAPDNAMCVQPPPDQEGDNACFPTEQKLQQRERARARLAQGLEPRAVQKRKKVIEQHFDDCGENLQSLDGQIPSNLLVESVLASDEESLSGTDSEVRALANAYAQWALPSTVVEGQPALHKNSTLAVDIEEMFTILSDPGHKSYGVEIVEVCGGNALTSYLCVRRKLHSGHCFELITGTDLTDPKVQAQVLSYLDLARPMVIVMSPICTPFGPLGHRNYILHRDAWCESFATAGPLANFCGKLALRQSQLGLFYVNEQPFPSSMYEIAPWPQVRARDDCHRVVFHQCKLGLQVNGLPCKKPTELTSNSTVILRQFAGLRCDSSHTHAILLGGNAHAARIWPHMMCSRLARGIELQAKALKEARSNRARPPFTSSVYPSVASGSGDPTPEETGSEPWRKCKGCLWRLHRADSLHNRTPGVCKYPDDEAVEFSCPGCQGRKNRSSEDHTFGPDCRLAYTKPREKAVQRRPFARKPASSEPTAGLKATKLGIAAEQAAELRCAPKSSSSRGPDPNPPDEDDKGSGVGPAAEADIEAAGQPARAVRGPDVAPRVRRTFREEGAQTPDAPDWTSFDAQATLRGLRHGTEADQRRLVRKLHLRWWHCSCHRMQALLKAAGLPKAVCDLIPEITDTCRVCRHWARPSPDAKPTNRMVIGFNVEIEGDLMFVRHKGVQHILLVLVCRGVRWTSATCVTDKQTRTLISALDSCWVAVFGPPQVLLFDGETGLDDEESTTYFQLRGITKRTAAPRQHTRIVDRKIAVLRDTLHKLGSQLDEEGLDVPFHRMVSDAVYALNSLTSVNGCSPYTAVLGRMPTLLPADDCVMSDGVPDVCSRHTYRLREIAVQAIAEGTAKERLKRALKSQTRPSGEELEYQLGQQVDWFREPTGKDMSGWRGPGTIVDLTRIEHGRVGVRTSTDQVLTVRLQDLRPSLTFMSSDLASFFHQDDPVALEGSQSHYAQQVVQDYVDALKPGVVLTLGQVFTKLGSWVETPQTETHRHLLQACAFLAESVFKIASVAAVRLAKSVRTLTQRNEFTGSMCLYWTSASSKQISFLHSSDTRISFVEALGQQWTEVRAIQLLLVPDESDWVASQKWIALAPETETEPAESVGDGASSSAHDRLTTIPEESTNGSDSALATWNELQSMFGESIKSADANHLSEAFAAISTEVAPLRAEPGSLQEAKDHARNLLPTEQEVPAWSQVSSDETFSFLTQEQLRDSLARCNKEPSSYIVLDSDEVGAYVALEAPGDMAKLVADVDRLPHANEVVEIRFYESHTRKAVIDRSDDLLTKDELVQHADAVVQATLDELKTWQGFNCFQRRSKSEAPCVIDVKWVYKWKYVKGERRIRARLCLRGFKETGADFQSNYSATASRFSQRLLVSECVLRGWSLASSDVPKAFLQGVSYEELSESTGQPMRDVSFELRGEALTCLRMLPGFQDFNARREVLHCLKPGTGCRDAPKCFSLKLRKATAAFGFQQSSVDSELELLFKQGELVMLILKHVDDLKMAAKKALIEEFVQHLSKTFGKMDIEWSSFTFCGVRHEQHSDGSVSLDQVKFLSACKPISQPAALAGGAEAILPEDARRHFLSLLMTVAYALLTRPDVAVFISALQRESHKAQVIHVRRLNKVLQWLQANPRKITYPVMKYPTALLQVSDSSYKARAEDGLSVRGLVSLRVDLADVQAGKKQTPCHLLDFASKQQRHVTRSTFSSELFAATDATDIGLLQVLAMHELQKGVLSADEAKSIMEGELRCATALALAVDARSVTAAVIAVHTKVPAEPSLLLHVRWLKQLLQRQRLSALFWTDTRSMISDALTKGSVSRELIAAVMSGLLQMDQPYEQQKLQ